MTATDAVRRTTSPWPALWALVIGFFMILVDSTIVSVATPTLIEEFDAPVATVVWVTSAYLLAYAVPLLVTGRLGDRFGPKRVYLVGLAVFTVASLWCGLTGTIEQLVVARAFQGLGASMMTPQTMAVITRTFPAQKRGVAMSLWGAVAGVAILTGPLLGGLLVNSLGWEWIFFVNVPVGVVGFVLAYRLVPTLPTLSHRFDVLGVVLSAAGMFLLVFGIQEGEAYSWSPGVWALIAAGVVVLGLFVVWQGLNRAEPLVPLALFRDRNFSLSNLAIATVAFAVTSMALPMMLWAQDARGWSAAQAALLFVPMAVPATLLAPLAGRLTDQVHPRVLATFGLGGTAVGLVWLALVMTPDVPVWQVVLPILLLGVANSFMWSPVSTSATRNLPMQQAGAGSGVYNATRQVGAVLGGAGIAAVMEARLRAYETLPDATEAMSRAMSQALLLPAAVLVVGVLAVQFYERPAHMLVRDSVR